MRMDETPAEPMTLSTEDQQALDALLAAEFDVAKVSAELQERAGRVGRLLGLLDGPAEAGSSDLAARTLATVLGREAVSGAEPLALCQDDEDALEALILAGGEVSRLPSRVRERASRLAALASLVSSTPVQAGTPRSNLIDATLARIDAAEEEQVERYRIGRRPGIRWADLVSVAAVMLVMASVAFPVLGSLRDASRRVACQTNLSRVAQAMGLYAGAHHSALPSATAGFGGRPWMNVGTTPEQSNSANLYVLVSNRYSRLGDLACSGNPNAPTVETSDHARDWSRLEEVSYSYQIQDGRGNRVWSAPTAQVIVADRSPVVLRIARRDAIRPEENSPNHGQRGQHALLSDGTVVWLKSPVLESGDNIWLPRAIEQVVAQIRQYQGMTGSEVPAGTDDALLGP